MHRENLLAFLDFLKSNLAGQTRIGTEAGWATQMAVLQGVARVILPHRIVREADAARQLPDLAPAGTGEPKQPLRDPGETAILAGIHDEAVERAMLDVYSRDYVNLDFGP